MFCGATARSARGLGIGGAFFLSSDPPNHPESTHLYVVMWSLGAIRDGAAGLVKQGAGAVKQGVEASAKLLENLDEVSQNGVTCLDSFFRVNLPAPCFQGSTLRQRTTKRLCVSTSLGHH